MLLLLLFGPALWMILGAAVLSAVDSRGDLFLWACGSPFGGFGVGLVLVFWPVVLLLYLR